MCCASNGQCIETKYCYNEKLTENQYLISAPSTSKLQAMVNTTEVPYTLTDPDQLKPCFSYFDAQTGAVNEQGVYTIDQVEIYSEPAVFTQTGSVLKLKNYTYAYGNQMSDAQDNPFLIDVIAQMQATTIMTKSAAAMQNIVLEEGLSQKETTNFDPF